MKLRNYVATVLVLVALLLPLQQSLAAPITYVDGLHQYLTNTCHMRLVLNNAQRQQLAYESFHMSILVQCEGPFVKNGTLLAAPGFDVNTARPALAYIYLTLQGQRGKPIPSNFRLKFDRMLDTLITNIKMNGRTKFNYDDLVVTGYEGEGKVFFISLTQQF
jgi:hypothetical protein